MEILNDQSIYVIGGYNGGFKDLTDGRKLSKACQSGHAGTSSCEICSPGTFASGIGNTMCQPCHAGYFSNSSGSDTCTQCIQSYTSQQGSTSCTPCPLFSTIIQDLGTSVKSCTCDPGYYGLPGSNCTSCPPGGICNDFGTLVPNIQGGYWREIVGGKPAFTQCVPPSACVGGQVNKCTLGYLGFRCATCADDFHYVNGHCSQCGKSAAGLLALYILIPLLAVILCSLLLRYSQAKVPSFLIVLEFIQVLSIFRTFGASMSPGVINSLLGVISVLNFNFDVFSPECSVSFGYWDKLTFVLCIPLILLVYVVGLHFSAWLAKKLKYSKAEILTNFSYLQTNVAFMVASVLYVYICSKTVEPFVCEKEIDGNSYIVSYPSAQCYDTDWYSHLPLLVFSLILYTGGFPLYCAYVVYRSKKHDSPELTLAKYSSLYSVYTDERWWWGISVIRIRRLMLVLIQLSGDNLVVSACSFAFVSAALYVQCIGKPYTEKFANYLETSMICLWMLFLYSFIFWDAGARHGRSLDGMSVFVLLVFSLFLAVSSVVSLLDLYKSVHMNKVLPMSSSIHKENQQTYELEANSISSSSSFLPQEAQTKSPA
eukprot:Phypoly_transcript_05317.p1 GENE.Phypoly_transcript_05317~~Phypoly_transcript_05317.p1  ORF type:complete len:652 (+),score=44.79 Phypoly_transcript_05317:166-1956(+)